MRRASSTAAERSAEEGSSFATRAADKIGEVSEKVSEPIHRVSEPIRDAFTWYSTALYQYPLRTNSATAAVLAAVGDSAAQMCEYKMGIMSPNKEGYNWRRTARMFFFGGVLSGPLLYVWYRTLHSVTSVYRVSYEPLVSGRASSLFLSWAAERSRLLQSIANLRVKEATDNSAARILIIKVLTDNLLAGPLCLHAYFACMGALEG
mgnify:CR=1 FL=1